MPGFGRQSILLAIDPINPIAFIHHRILSPIVMECGDGIAAFHKRGAREALRGPGPTQRKLSHPKPRRSAASQSGDSVTALHIAHVRLHAKRKDCLRSPGRLSLKPSPSDL